MTLTRRGFLAALACLPFARRFAPAPLTFHRDAFVFAMEPVAITLNKQFGMDVGWAESSTLEGLQPTGIMMFSGGKGYWLPDG